MRSRPARRATCLHGARPTSQRFERAARRRGACDDALALWRGPALAEFSEPFARREGARLEELRLGVPGGPHRRRPGPRRARRRSCAELEAARRGATRCASARGGCSCSRCTAPAARRRRSRPTATFRDDARRASSGIEPSAELRALELSMLRQDEPAPPAPAPARPPDRAVSYVASGDDVDRLPGRRGRAAGHRARHGWVCSFQPGWERPEIARFYERLAGMGRLILFDKRGTGLSDRVARDRAARGAHGRHARGARRRRLRARGDRSASARAGRCPRCSPRPTPRGRRRSSSWGPSPAGCRGPTTPSTSRSSPSRPRSGASPSRAASSRSAPRRSPTTRRRSAGTAPTSSAARAPARRSQIRA